MTATTSAGGRGPARLALTAGQVALMATSLVLSLALGYAGGLGAVGALAPAMLVFQLTCGVLQRSLAEATLLRAASATRTAAPADCRRSVATAVVGGAVGTVVAVLSSLAVPGGSVDLAVAYAVGIPFAMALDIGRSAGVAGGASRAVLVETVGWLVVQSVLLVAFAAVGEPLLVCLSWTLVNAAFALLAAGRALRRPDFGGLLRWVRDRRDAMGAASLDALLVGLTPLLALQVTALVADAYTLGVIRVVQQLFGPLALVSIILRRVLVYQRTAGTPTTRGRDLRDGALAWSTVAVGAAVLGVAVVLARDLVPALAFLPVGGVLLAAGLEKAALGFSYGATLSRFVDGDFGTLLRARYLMLGVTVVAAPLLTVWFGAVGYLVAATVGLVGYALVVVALPRPARPVAERVGAGGEVS
ncbi:hypothetical protein [Micromonospora sp. SH-82]|uniref:hypothetical protein n=1 Tax=Micromonospora sp. SH-82 TaxID=3132938 RepID=UPI003EBD6D19